MAEGGSKILETLRAEITCPLCLDTFQDPKRLPCEHIYCRQCLRSLALRSIDGSISCPECRRNTPVPNYDVSIFSTPHQINRLKETYEKNLMSTVTEIKNEQLSSSVSVPQLATCKVHDSQPLALYCESCKSLVCRDCVIISCSKENHKHGFIDDMVKSYQVLLEQELTPIRKLYQHVSNQLEAISTAEREQQSKRDEQCRKVEITFDALSDILAQEKKYFIDAIEYSFQQQKASYSTKKVELSEIITMLTLLIESIQKSSSTESNHAFLTNMDNKKIEIERAKNVFRKTSLHPMKVPEMEFDLINPAELKDLCVKNILYQKGDPHKSHLGKSTNLHTKFFGKPFEIVMHLDPRSIKRNFIKKSKKVVHSELHCCYEDYMQILDVRQISPNKYSLSTVPHNRGRQELYILCEDSHVCGSPIPLYVAIDPKDMPVSKFQSERLQYPGGLKVNNGRVYVSEDEKQLSVLEATSLDVVKRLPILGVNEVLVDADCIYVTDVHKHRLIKMTLSGTVISSIGTQGREPGEFNFPNGIRLSKDNEIYVCDTQNHRIQVFDQNLKLLKILGAEGNNDGCFNSPDDLEFDDAGNIYVVDQDNNRIQVLSPQGKHMYNIGRFGREKGALAKPVSAAIHRDMIYITEYYNKRISVFTTAGEFITTFGERILKHPECIAIDRDGYVFVTDSRSLVIKF